MDQLTLHPEKDLDAYEREFERLAQRGSTVAAPIQRQDPWDESLQRKAAMEHRMQRHPTDQGLRLAYLDHVGRLSRAQVTLSYVLLPELGHPLYFRCGTSDVANLVQIFGHLEYDFPLPQAPARILDLGAYAGYAAVYLARRFPEAELVCVEPSQASFRLLLLNTLPYRRIRRLAAAVWSHSAALHISSHCGGDWGNMLAEGSGAGAVPGHSVPEILRLHGWDRADLVKCDVEGSEVEVFADPGAPWIREMDCLAIETHEHMRSGCEVAVARCFDPALFEQRRSGEFTIFARRGPWRSPQPAELRLIDAQPLAHPLVLRDVAAEDWGFYVYDGEAFQLHPNAPGGPPAQLVTTREFSGQRWFTVSVALAGALAQDVVFTIIVRRPGLSSDPGAGEGGELLRAQRTLKAGQELHWQQEVPPLSGRLEVVLQTEMAPGSTHNNLAWARWLQPRFR